MSRAAQFFRQALRACGAAVGAFVLWTLWLALSLLLALQVYVLATEELQVPGWVLESLERRLESSGIHTQFGRTTFDPSGRLLMQDVKVSLQSFNEPVLTADSIFVRLDPLALAIGRVELRELRLAGASCLAPAMLSSSGRSEQLVHHIDGLLRPGASGEFVVEALTARIAGLAVRARGTIYIAPRETRIPIAELIARRYTEICRQLLVGVEKLNALEEPTVEVEFAPSESRGAVASVVLLARGLNLDAPVPLQITDLHVTTRFPLLGETPVMTRARVSAGELRLPRNATARGVRALVQGMLKPALLSFEPGELELSADSASAEGIAVEALSARLSPGPLPRLYAETTARILGAPLSTEIDTHFSLQTATVRFDGALAPGWLDVVSQRLGRDVRRFVDFKAPVVASGGRAVFSAGWKFTGLEARVATGAVNAYRVVVDEAHGRVELTPNRFLASEAFARLGNNFARGSFEQNFGNRDFRFLLQGELKPLAISGWFGPWWPNFFQMFEFPAAGPAASVDVRGRWRENARTTVFVFADSLAPVIRKAPLDRARALLFIRPGFFDGLEVFGTLGDATARGTFTYVLDPVAQDWKEFLFAGTSSIDLGTAEKLIGPISADWFSPFQFERAPAVRVKGRLERRAAGFIHQDVVIDGRSDRPFRFLDFPLEGVSFRATLRDDGMTVENVQAGVAGGLTTGQAKITGTSPNRRLSFDYALKDASLGRAVAILQEYTARKNSAPAPTPGKFIQEKNNVRLDLTAKAEGALTDPFSYQGRGVAELKGAELGEVRLLGGLSETLRFTALRFTAANANFRIEGPKLAFPEISITGDNSAIQAHGEFALDRKQLDFNAKVYPFQESGFILKKILDVALSPLSNVFEVKLTGTLDKPSWGLVLGPANFLRSLTQPGPGEPAPKPADPAPSADMPEPVKPPAP